MRFRVFFSGIHVVLGIKVRLRVGGLKAYKISWKRLLALGLLLSQGRALNVLALHNLVFDRSFDFCFGARLVEKIVFG